MAMSSSDSLFSADLIPPRARAELPDGYSIRPLQRDDYARGHLEPLKDLTHVGEISEEQWLERFDWMLSCKGTYYTVVIVNEARGKRKEIVATGTLFAEKKLCVQYLLLILKSSVFLCNTCLCFDRFYGTHTSPYQAMFS
jgi:glucosamine-phosphate N-acetyltransferase